MVDGSCSKKFPKPFCEETIVNVNGYLKYFGFHMHKQSHAIIRLQVHLLGEQSVVFITDNVEAAAQNAASRDTTLTAWFKLNQQYQMATGILYYTH